MAKRYCGKGGAAVGSSVTILTLISATTVRPRITDVIVGCAAAPADTATKFEMRRFTAVGTEGSGFTPVALDPADPASASDCGVGTFSGEPTYTSNATVLGFSMNARATFRWVAAPGCELVAPPTANNGIGLVSVSVSSGTATHDATFLFEE